jgi:hypothetical protein
MARSRTLAEGVRPYRDALQRIHDDPRCDDESRLHLQTLRRELNGMASIVDKVLSDFGAQAKTGRPKLTVEERFSFDLAAYVTTEMRKYEGKDGKIETNGRGSAIRVQKVIDAIGDAADELDVSPETVRRARGRFNKQRKEEARIAHEELVSKLRTKARTKRFS